MVRVPTFLVVLSLALVTLVSAAQAERRVALVIGNDRYTNLPAAEQLQNAVSDARAVRASLESLGFEVLSGENVSRADLIERLSAFGARLQGGDIGFVFFAGHGVALSGANYILPSDIPAPRSTGREEEARLADNAVSESRIIERVTSTGAKVVVIALDACRNNPLAAPGGRSLGGSRGLSRIPETEGLMSIYSAGVGQVAYDRLNDADHNPNSVFTRVFADVLKTPGLDLRGVAVETRRRVAELARSAGLTQSPGYYEQIDGDVYLAGPVPKPVMPTTSASSPLAAEQADFAIAMQGGGRSALEAFLSAHPSGPLADIVRRERDRIDLVVSSQASAPSLASNPPPDADASLGLASVSSAGSTSTRAAPVHTPPVVSAALTPRAADPRPAVVSAALHETLSQALAVAAPRMSPAEREREAQIFAARPAPRAMALSASGSVWQNDGIGADNIGDLALEACQIATAAPCRLLATDSTVAPPGQDGTWPSRDMPRVRYAGRFDPAAIPALPPSMLKGRKDLQAYNSATGFKAVALNPIGVLTIAKGMKSADLANRAAVSQCSRESVKRQPGGSCVLYATGSDVVLPQGRTVAPLSPDAMHSARIEPPRGMRPTRSTPIRRPATPRCLEQTGQKFCF